MRKRGSKPPAAIAAILGLVGAVALICSCNTAGPAKAERRAPDFDGQSAYRYLEKQCSFGPRPPGSQAHSQTKGYLVSELSKFADSVEELPCEAVYDGARYEFTNILAHFVPGAKKRVILAAHWDTRPVADQEIDPEKAKKPILGANDGASGVAILLELARMFKTKQPPVGVDILLTDGEDLGEFEKGGFCFGSKAFAKDLKGDEWEYGILLDMVGEKGVKIPKEGHSETEAPKVVEKVWSVGRELGHGSVFVDEYQRPIYDDHVAFLGKGIPMIDLIDFDYAYWHTLDDTPDKCSAESLKAVGEVVAEVIYREQPGG
jgi:glutaminyl-peptide cyclotransferase